MKKTIISAVGAMALSTSAFADDNITRTLDLRGFDQIEIAGVYELNVEVGPEFSITLTGEEEELDRVQAAVRGSVLTLDRSKGKRRWGRDNQGIEAVITLPALVGLDISGVVDGEVAGIDASRFELDLSGVGDVELEGECETFEADVSGVGDLDAEKLQCRTVSVEVSGVGSASVYASEEVDAEVSGMGDIDVYGSPEKVRKESSMFADVTIR